MKCFCLFLGMFFVVLVLSACAEELLSPELEPPLVLKLRLPAELEARPDRVRQLKSRVYQLRVRVKENSKENSSAERTFQVEFHSEMPLVLSNVKLPQTEEEELRLSVEFWDPKRSYPVLSGAIRVSGPATQSELVLPLRLHVSVHEFDRDA